MERWQAETTRGGLARVMLGIAPVTAAFLAGQIIWQGLSPVRVALASFVLAVGGIATARAYRHATATLEVALRGDVLVVPRLGEHLLAPGSLSCVRAHEQGKSGSVMGTYLIVPLLPAKSLLLLFPTVLDDALYLADRELTCDAWLGPEANVLLDRLTPFVAGARGRDAAGPARYAMALRRPLLRGDGAFDALSIFADRVALGKGGAVVAEATAHEIAFSTFRFARPSDASGPSLPDAPGLLLELVAARVTLTIGAHPVFLEGHWRHLDEGSAPEYLVGLGELMRLQRILEISHAPAALGHGPLEPAQDPART
ncbi:MAG: hypothetical protein JNK04_07955 [Myxococcales bacterium]|nr:hypothetical protein [Myxococcales bacterium]